MRILVVGCGSIGKRHLKNLKDAGVEEIMACDVSDENLEFAKNEAGAETFKDMDEALEKKPDAVMICTPPHLHLAMAKKVLEKGLNLFLEKPVAEKLDGLDELEKLCDGKVVLVGYNLRFNPCLEEAKRLIEEGAIGRVMNIDAYYGNYLPNWRPNMDYRKVYSSQKDMGGGIILDCSHEIDYILWLMGKARSVTCTATKASSLELDVEDIAEVNFRFDDGRIAHAHLDFVRPDLRRTCDIVGEKGTISIDLIEYKLRIFRDGKWEEKGFEGGPSIAYVRQLAHFLECLKEKKQTRVKMDDGIETLRVSLAARESSDKGEEVKL
ncbi:TPA: Gfo/Idh/MocA family oxidoreductase [Candidatus Micrarchaeota archaeon]|nr:Gfo/Idh/MocA family oxidoreductase [Candidatus Micrarchaeota archaeon]